MSIAGLPEGSNEEACLKTYSPPSCLISLSIVSCHSSLQPSLEAWSSHSFTPQATTSTSTTLETHSGGDSWISSVMKWLSMTSLRRSAPCLLGTLSGSTGPNCCLLVGGALPASWGIVAVSSSAACKQSKNMLCSFLERA